MNFSLLTPAKIIFGEDSILQVAPILKQWDQNVLFVAGLNHPFFSQVCDSLNQAKITHFVQQVSGEPTLNSIRKLVYFAKENQCEVVLALGGGSVLDSGKAVSALLTNDGDVLDYLEVVGAGKALQNPAAKMIAVPTTAGTGSEVTKNAVILVEDKQVKVSLRSEGMIPTVALIDPSLTVSLPAKITASTGMDALTQVIEPFVSIKANPMTDLFCESGIKSVSKALLTAYKDGTDLSARNGMAWASLMGGLALANAGLGAVHGFAAVIGGMFDAPHGDICARLLPVVFEVNARELEKSSGNHEILTRFQQVSEWLTGDQNATILSGVNFLKQLAEDLKIPALSNFGMNRQHVEEVVEKAKKASSMKGNPIQLSDEALKEILLKAIE